MPEIVVVSATSTGSGKTWVTARLIEALRDEISIAVRKPVESFTPGDERDSELLAGASGEPPDVVCPPHRRYELPMAPPIAAAGLGRPSFSVADLGYELAAGSIDADLVLVEGVGGPYSPLSADGDTVALAELLGAAKVISVVDASLGAINAALTVIKAFPGVEVLTFLNHFDPDDEVHRTNWTWLTAQGHLVHRSIDELADAFRSRVP
jgi:dethiobiotin synthetase